MVPKTTTFEKEVGMKEEEEKEEEEEEGEKTIGRQADGKSNRKEQKGT